MPVYCNLKCDTILFVNTKVASTSIKEHCSRGELILVEDITRDFLQRPPQMIIITRNPYDRVESFFKSQLYRTLYNFRDQLLRLLNVETAQIVGPKHWETYQNLELVRVMTQAEYAFPPEPGPGVNPVPAHKIKHELDMAMIKELEILSKKIPLNTLPPSTSSIIQHAHFLGDDYCNRKVTFEDFIKKGIGSNENPPYTGGIVLSSSGKMGEGALVSQVEILHNHNVSTAALDVTLKIEDIEATRKGLLKHFNIELLHRNQGSTAHRNYGKKWAKFIENAQPVKWTPELKEIVYNRYKQDFQELGYEK